MAYTEEAWEQEMDNVEKSGMGMGKKIFILAKTAFVVFQTVKGIIAWRKSKKRMSTPAMLCLLFSALIVCSVCAYKFTSKKIKPLVTLQAMSHYLCFIILHVLVGYNDCRNAPMRGKLLRSFYLFHLIYWALIVFSFKTATCTKENFYPDAFIINNCFSFGIYVMVYVLHSRGYMLEWSDEDEASKNLFEKQTERYFSFYTFLVKWHIFELVIGKSLDSFSDAITCSDEKWIFATGKSSLFMMLHIVGTMMGTGMTRQVFIKTAKAEGLFGGVEDGDSEHDDALPLNRKSPPKSSQRRISENRVLKETIHTTTDSITYLNFNK